MANWKVKIDLSEPWQKFEDDEDFDAFKEEVIPILRDKVEEVQQKLGDDEAMRFEDFITDIENCDDEEEFDWSWQNMYDWADENLVWLGTF